MDEDYTFALMDEPYNVATTTGQWQQWLQFLLEELEELHETWELQEHLRLPPWHQQRLLRTGMELWDGIELARDTPPELQQTRGFRRLRELWELPDEIIKDLQELSQASQEQEKPYDATESLPDEDLQQHPL